MMIGFENFKDKFLSLGIENSNQLAAFLLENYSVALLPSTDFYFQKEELFFRLAFVDFNGEKVLNAFKNSKQKDEAFIMKHCNSIYQGTVQLIKFIRDLE